MHIEQMRCAILRRLAGRMQRKAEERQSAHARKRRFRLRL
jgi:hypothetical protein